MRKSFTQLSSLLVLLLLSVQMGFAQPELADNGLDPADGATVSSGITEFTLTFTGEVVPGTGGAIGLYDAADNLIRVFQVNGPNTVSAGGNATFADNTVTIEFSGVNYDENSAYYVSIEDKAIKDASGQNYVPADVFGSNEEWNFNIEDTSAPTLADEDALAPADDATDVGRDSTFRINFSEQVEFVDGYTPKLGDIALYTSTDMAPGQNQEGGDLLTLNGPYDVTLDGSGMFIDIEWFNYYSNLLPAYTEMYVRIKPDILQDMSGNKFAGINNNTGWNFSTKATATFDPAIKAYRGNEEQASGEIWTDVNFWIVFAEDIYTVDGTQVTSSNIADELGDDISLVDAGGNVVAATLSVVADSIRINPDNDLTSSSYTVNLNGNVIRYFDGSENNAASKTYASGDWTAPEITQFYADNFRGTSFDIFTKADEDCSIKYIVVKKGSSAPVLADIIGYADDGSNTTGTSREHRGTGTYTEQEGNLGDFYVIGTGESADTVEIFAEGTIPVNYPVESQRRVDGLPATQGPDNGEGEYEVYAVAYDASTTGLYDPDYFTDSGLSAAQQIQGNISGIEDTEAYTDDILMPSVWFDGDSATSGELLNADMLNPVELGVALADLHKKGTIYLNFNEDIRLANGAPITNTSISSFITVEDGLSQVGFEANYSADTKQIAIVADSSFKSATNVTVTIASSQIEDMAGNEFQPATAGLAIQDYTVELYNPVLAHFTPADAEVDFRENCITVKFNDIISAPAYLETVTGQEELLNNDPVSQLWVGRFFEITEGDINGASIGDQSVKGEFDFTVEYDEENDITTVTMCGDEFDWNSEAWYYVRAEERLMDSNRSLLDDGGGIIATSTPARTEEEPFSDITTDANDNLTISFQYGDTRSPEVVFFDPRTSDLLLGTFGLDPIDGKTNIEADDTIGVYIDEYVLLGFADEIDFIAPGGQLVAPVEGNAFRRYFSLENSEGEAISFDIVDVGIETDGDSLVLYIDPYTSTEGGGFEEDEVFEAGVDYTVTYISTQLEEDQGEAYQDQAKNKVIDEVVATFTGAATAVTPTVDAVYTPAHGATVSASTSEVVIEFNETFNSTTIGTIPTITVESPDTDPTVTVGTGVMSNDYYSITYPLTGVVETDTFNVIVNENDFGFTNGATWPNPSGTDSTWTFYTSDGTPPAVDLLVPDDDATNVPLTTDLIISFDEDVLPVTGIKLFLWNSGTDEKFRIDASNCEHIGGDSLVIDNSKFASFIDYETEYHVIVNPGFVEDAAGNQFAGLTDPTDWNFTTGADPAPSYTSFSPEVETQDENSSLSITFSEPVMAVNNMFISLYETDGTGPVGTNLHQWEVDEDLSPADGNYHTTYTFTPDASDLEWGKFYTVEIQAGAFVDQDGNDIYPTTTGNSTNATDVGDLSTDATWVFFVGDQTAPTVTFWPAVPDTFSIPYNAHLYMHFSEPIAMDDGTQVSVDPTLLSNNIASFISLEKGTGPTSVDFGVEFVGSDKQTLRITPNDVDGYNYDGTDTNPTMETETAYNLSIIADNLTYELVDANGNVLDITDGGDVDFVTEDITSPVITGLVATNPTANSADIEFDIDEDGTAWVYAVQGAPETDPTVAEIKENAQWTDDVETGTVDAGTVEVGETVGSNDFTVYVVAEDDETDPYADPDPTLWIFDETEDNVNAIRDLLPAPNVSETVSATFTTCDDDAPQFVTSVPLHGAEGVATDQEIVIVFSEDITTSATTPNAVTLRKSMNNAAVGSTFNIIGSDSIVITPDVALEEETTYYVEIDRYAITDLGGCDGPNLFGEWVGKDNLEFSTIDMTAPVVDGYFPTVDSTCVETDLTYVRVYLDETNDLAKAGEGDENILVKHNGVIAQTVPFHSEYVTFGNDEENGKYLEISLEGFILLSDVQVTIEIPADVIADEYDNVLSSAISWSFYTIDNVPPVVSWTLYDWNTYFNNSDPDEIGIDKFNAEYVEGGEGETVTSAPTHSLLKIEFDESIDMQAGDEWLSLTDFNENTLSDVSGAASDGILSRAEIFDNVEVGDLEYNDDSVTSDLYIYQVAANYIVIGYSDSVVSDLLVEAVEDGTSDLASATGYFGSLMSETVYPVTIKSGSISDPLDCDDNRIVRENEDVVVLDTRDDTPPAITFSTCVDECIDGQAPITLTFSREVVKSSYDISWTDIEHESHTYDNLPLSTDDIEATGDDRYIEFYQLASADSTVNSVVDVTDVTFDGKTGITFVPESKLSSDSLYMIKFNKWTVKEYIENDPTGALFEGDSCYFRVSDYLAPYVVETTGLSPDSAETIASSVTDLVINFNEDVALGAEGLTTKVRREDGSVYAEFTIGSDDSISIDDNEVILYIEDGFEQFTKYYVEMPDGFITDFDTICTPNNFEGFSASLDSGGDMLSADWWFQTTDAMPPQLISVDMNYTDLDPEALFPLVGDTVSRYSDLEMIFDENIQITSNNNKGIVIYHDNSDNPFYGESEDNDFGNAIEFIPWSEAFVAGGKITITGTDKYNDLDSNKIVINPETVFDSKGTYYVRVDGDDVTDDSGNKWSDSDSVNINPVRDYEWYFTIVDDVVPVLVNTTPDYDGVDAAGDYGDGLPATDKAYVQADLVMEFYTASLENNGEPLSVARGDNTRMLRIFEYTYDAALADYKSEPWIELPITDASIEFDGNKVIVNDVILKDGIRNVVPDQDGDVTNDSAYYVTVDPGAVLNGYDESSTWWPGIENGFRWRFTTQSDELFVDGYEILSPKGEEAVHQTIEAVDSLVVAFNEGIGSLGSEAFGHIVITDLDGDSVFAAIEVTPENCVDSMLYVDISDILVDEKNYAITIQEGTFGDTATIANPNFAFGGDDEWFFHTGDNTPPVPDTTLLYAGEDCAPSEFVMEMIFDETLGVDIATGQITFTDTSGADVIDPIAAESLAIDSTLNVVTAQVAGLPDTTDITVTLSEGLFVDRDTISPLENPEVSWTFRTADNSGPVPTLVEPSAIVETTEVEIQIIFNEPVSSTDGWVNVNGNAVLFSTEDDTIFSAVVSDELLSDQVNVIAFTDSSFFDTAVCGRNVVDIATTLEFDVADIDNPEATYYPNGEYDNSDYTGVDLTMMFNDNVTAAEAEAGKNIYIFDADTDLPVDTIASYEFTSEDNSSYQALVDLYFGSFYVLADTASFFDAEAVAFAQNYNGISSDTVWAFDVVDSSFGTCVEGQSPAVNATGVETTTQISITFCDEINIGPAGRTDRFVSVANADEQFTYVVVDSMIEGNTLTIDVEDLSENTQYSVYIQEGAITDEYGNEWDVNTDAFWWPFTTGDFTKPEVTLEAGEAAEGTDVQATMTTTENGTLYLIEEGVAIDDVDVMDGAIDADKAVKVSAAADVPANVNVNGLVPGTYNAVAVDASGNISEKSTNTFVIVSYPEVTIADIQGEGDVSPYADQIVVTSGTVTGIDEDGSGFFMQDANEARGGIYVYDSELAANVGVGTSVKITATAEEFYTLTQLSDVIAYEFTAKVVETEVIEITAAEVGEDYEGVLVKVDSLKTTGLPNDESYGEWYTADTENDVDVTIDEQLFTFVPDAGQRYDITGVCNYTYDEYKLAPRSIADIEIVTGIKMLDINIDIYPNPFDTYVKFDVSRDVEITKAVITNIAGQLVKQVDYPANTIQTNELRSGVYFISLQTEQGIAKTARIIKR